jgi:triosephosphate isomerase
MPKKHTPIVIGNWKMNPATLADAKKLILAIRKGLGRRRGEVDIVVAPPYPYISEMQRLTPSQRTLLAAQDFFSYPDGAHTGEVSLSMLKSVGATSVIIGHSERRAKGETEADVHQDIQALTKAKMTTILCVGEKQRDSQGLYFGAVEGQLRSALKDVTEKQLSHMVIAYEPVWAIGTGKTATPEDAHEMKLFIQKVLTDLFDRKTVEKVRIVYGGSVNASNAAELLSRGGVDGFLVGGASLKAAEFVAIINHAEAYAKQKTT